MRKLFKSNVKARKTKSGNTTTYVRSGAKGSKWKASGLRKPKIKK